MQPSIKLFFPSIKLDIIAGLKFHNLPNPDFTDCLLGFLNFAKSFEENELLVLFVNSDKYQITKF